MQSARYTVMGLVTAAACVVQVLIELQARGGKDKDDDAAMDLSGDAGAVGRLLVSGKQGGWCGWVVG